jgi:hypothetical protein
MPQWDLQYVPGEVVTYIKRQYVLPGDQKILPALFKSLDFEIMKVISKIWPTTCFNFLWSRIILQEIFFNLLLNFRTHDPNLTIKDFLGILYIQHLTNFFIFLYIFSCNCPSLAHSQNVPPIS